MLARIALFTTLLAVGCQPSPQPVPTVPDAAPVALHVPPEPLPVAPEPRPVLTAEEQAALMFNQYVAVAGIKARTTQMREVAIDFYTQGRFKDALESYTLWTPSTGCGNCDMAQKEIRIKWIACCHLHLNEPDAAVRVCLDATERSYWDGGGGLFIVRLYDEAGQLDDLAPLLDAVEKRVIDRQFKPWLLTPEAREKLLEHMGTNTVRRHLREPIVWRVPPWPDGVPKPAKGSLPKALPR